MWERMSALGANHLWIHALQIPAIKHAFLVQEHFSSYQFRSRCLNCKSAASARWNLATLASSLLEAGAVCDFGERNDETFIERALPLVIPGSK